MGGIVTTATACFAPKNNQFGCFQELVVNRQLTLATAPNLPYQDIRELFPVCMASWNQLFSSAKTKSGRAKLSDVFNCCFSQQIQQLNDGGTMLSLLMRSSSKKPSRNRSPVAFALGYCAYNKSKNEKDCQKKLGKLGLLTALCLTIMDTQASLPMKQPSSIQSLYAWAAVIKYVFVQMTSDRFNFVRTVDGTSYSASNASSRRNSTRSSQSDSAAIDSYPYDRPPQLFRRCPQCHVNKICMGYDICDECMLLVIDEIISETTSNNDFRFSEDHTMRAAPANHFAMITRTKSDERQCATSREPMAPILSHSVGPTISGHFGACYTIQEGIVDILSSKGASHNNDVFANASLPYSINNGNQLLSFSNISKPA